MPLRPIHKIRIAIALMALVLPVLALAAIVAGVILFRYDVLDLRASQLWLAAAASVGGLALVVLAIARTAKWLSWRWLALLVIPAMAPIITGAAAVDYLNRHPSTAEVSTDLVDPPVFSGPAAAPFPQGLEAVGRARHGSVRSLTLRQPPQQAFDLVLAAAKARTGWRVTASHPPETIEGTAVFGRFRYERAWSLRLRPELGGGSLVDMRIRSRPGEPDLGGNAEEVQAFLDAVARAAR